jgi:N-acetylmuramoyl-L-alanine amidase
MSALLAIALVAAAPGTAPMSVLVSTARGDTRVPVRTDEATGPVIAGPALLAPLGGRVTVEGAWAEVEVARQPFRFPIGVPLYAVGSQLKPIAGAAVVRRDTLFLPIQFVTQVLPSELKERFRYDLAGGRLVELTGRTPALLASTAADPTRLPNGLRKGHVVAIDPGHGGTDPGNPGIYFPRGLREKDVTLRIGLLTRQQLLNRGVAVIMTRTTDTLINLGHRGAYCRERCDLFVSLHVNSLKRRAGYTRVRGFETYYLDAARTEDAARVAEMENDAVRFEEAAAEEPAGGLDFILKDLQLNEHLRESVRLAELMQSHLAEVHSGPDKGVKPAPFTVLTTARRPAILVELGFSTNPEDARLMAEAHSQRNLAASIADAVVAYLLEYERRVGLDGGPSVRSGPGSE